MGNLVTKYTTNNIELNESSASDIVHYEVAKEKSPTASGQTRTGLLKNMFNFDPRSPSTFITRTPIAMFRNNSGSKFNHQELNESVESQIDLDILTPEEQNSLDSNTDLAKTSNDDLLPDPRSPITEITRTPIVAIDEAPKKKDENLVKKLADKLIATAITNEEDTKPEVKDKIASKKPKNIKNLIFEDDENVFDLDRFSTPPKKTVAVVSSSRTPLSCVGNTNTPKSRAMQTSTPKSKFNHDENSKSVSKIPVSARRLH